jgi:hypothetical protein
MVMGNAFSSHEVASLLKVTIWNEEPLQGDIRQILEL